MKEAVFWDVASCRSGVNRRFGGTYRLHHQGRRENIRKSAREASVRDVKRSLRYVPPKRRLTPHLHGAFFIVTAVKTSNLTKLNVFSAKWEINFLWLSLVSVAEI
jgi:hypothetical protein